MAQAGFGPAADAVEGWERSQPDTGRDEAEQQADRLPGSGQAGQARAGGGSGGGGDGGPPWRAARRRSRARRLAAASCWLRRGSVEAGKRVRRGAAFGWAPLLPQAPSALPEGPRNSPGARRRAMQAAEGRRAQAMAAAVWSRCGGGWGCAAAAGGRPCWCRWAEGKMEMVLRNASDLHCARGGSLRCAALRWGARCAERCAAAAQHVPRSPLLRRASLL